MKLSDSLSNVGRPIAYYPNLSKFFGSVNATLFFCQLYYWLERKSNELGVYKTLDEWSNETGMSIKEINTARRILKEKGYLIETEKRLDHKMFYDLDLEVVDNDFANYFNEISPTSEKDPPEMPKGSFGNNPKGSSSIIQRLHTEITTENISAKRAFDKLEKPNDVSEQVWQDYVKHRKLKKASISKTIIDGLRKEAFKAGLSLQEAISLSMLMGWQGFRAEWAKNTVKTKNKDKFSEMDDYCQKLIDEENMKERMTFENGVL